MNDWATLELALAIDLLLLAATVTAIGFAVVVLRRLRALKAAREEWAQQIQTFAERADAAEASYARLRDLLAEEAVRRREDKAAAEAAEPATVAADDLPPQRTALKIVPAESPPLAETSSDFDRPPRLRFKPVGESSILAMQ